MCACVCVCLLLQMHAHLSKLTVLSNRYLHNSELHIMCMYLVAVLLHHSRMLCVTHIYPQDHISQLMEQIAMLFEKLEQEKERAERLEGQVNDVTELHQHEVRDKMGAGWW